jgi:uncharacterized protein (TIGR02118 family)
MSVCLFLSFWGAPLDAPDVAKVKVMLAAIPKLAKALVHTASAADDPYLKDESPPQFVLQLYFDQLPELEAALSRNGPLAALREFPALAKAEATQQAMTARNFPVPEPRQPGCTYLVAYQGAAEDLNAWLGHYLDSHIPTMSRFPGLRELEVYTRLDWISELPFRRVDFMQRNKVAFDSAAALTAALNSPVRHEMRADFKTFPPFTGPVTHFAMTTRVVHPPPQSR